METTPPATTITDDLLAELEQLAGKATPGPYRQCGADTESKSCACGQVWSTATDELVAIAHNGDMIIDAPDAGQPANSQYLAAANPATILALLQHVRELRVKADRYDWLRDQHGKAHGTVWASIWDYSKAAWVSLDAYYREDFDGDDLSLDAAIDAARSSTN